MGKGSTPSRLLTKTGKAGVLVFRVPLLGEVCELSWYASAKTLCKCARALTEQSSVLMLENPQELACWHAVHRRKNSQS